MSKILIVGAGITGGVVNHGLLQLLRQAKPTAVLPEITVWESSEFAGGRMKSLQLDDESACLSRCDLGVQYISQGVGGSGFNDVVYEYLTNRGTLKLLPDNERICGMRPEHKLGKHYIAPRGTSSIVSALLEGAELVTNKKLEKLTFDAASRNLMAHARDGAEEFDAVVSTTMAPQLVKILGPKLGDVCVEKGSDGGVQITVCPDLLQSFNNVKYSSRFALAAFYELPSIEEKQSVLSSVPWGAKYIMDDDIIRYVSIENFKYEHGEVVCGLKPDNVISLLVHTSVPFGLAHKEVLHSTSASAASSTGVESKQHPDTQGVIDTILRSVGKPQVLPALLGHTPIKVQLVGWEHSQVTRSYHAGAADQVGLDTSRGVLGSTTNSIDPVGSANSEAGKEAHTKGPAPALVLSVSADGTANLLSQGGAAESRLPLLMLAGDAFTESNFDGCVKSGSFAAQAVAKYLLE